VLRSEFPQIERGLAKVFREIPFGGRKAEHLVTVEF
jgi:hypothetical protein